MRRFLILLLALTLLLLSGCASRELSEEEKALVGSWAFDYSEDVASLELKPNGKAVYYNKNYTYHCEDGQLILTGSRGEQLSVRYVLEDGALSIYKETVYTCSGFGKPEGLVGLWEAPDGHSSFEFTDEGTFSEDGFFSGSYSVDPAAGTIKLVYNDNFEDTVLYYSIDGFEMTVEYPWPMVPAE